MIITLILADRLYGSSLDDLIAEFDQFRTFYKELTHDEGTGMVIRDSAWTGFNARKQDIKDFNERLATNLATLYKEPKYCDERYPSGLQVLMTESYHMYMVASSSSDKEADHKSGNFLRAFNY